MSTRRSTSESGSMPDRLGTAGSGAQGPCTGPADSCATVDEHIALIAAQVHSDTQERDKRAARRHQRDRSTMNRWRRLGVGSPVKACLDYVLRCTDPERVAAAVLSAARLARLKDRTTPELIALYWELRTREVDHEADDNRLDAVPSGGSSWHDRANASERDGGTDILIGSIERIFAIRDVSDAEVFGAERAQA